MASNSPEFREINPTLPRTVLTSSNCDSDFEAKPCLRKKRGTAVLVTAMPHFMTLRELTYGAILVAGSLQPLWPIVPFVTFFHDNSIIPS